MALAIRFCQGVSCGAMLVGRTYLSDITDETNDARAFALVGIVWGFGDIIGPMLGGLLSQPAEQYASSFVLLPTWIQHSLLTYPYALPCIVVSAVGFVDFVLAYAALPETRCSDLPTTRKLNDSAQDVNDDSARTWWYVLKRQPGLNLVCAVCFSFGNGIAAYDALVPVWVHNQLHFLPKSLGLVQSFSGLVSVFASYCLINRLVVRFGTTTAFRISLMVVTLGYISPAVDICLGMQSDTAASYVFLCLAYGFKGIGIESCFTGVTLLLKRCAPPELFGTVQGIGSMFLNLGLAVGPLWGPSLFAVASNKSLSLSAVPFAVLALLTVITNGLTFALPSSLDGDSGGLHEDKAEPLLQS